MTGHRTNRDRLAVLAQGIPPTLPPPAPATRCPSVPHAPAIDVRRVLPTAALRRQAVRNALRYFPREWHAELAPEFKYELDTYGHIYMYRFMPRTRVPSSSSGDNSDDDDDGDYDYEMRAHPIDDYPAQCKQAAALMAMIMNNLDPAVAQYPHELVTYGGNGSVFGCWAHYLITMRYLAHMTEEQTLVMMSGHPQGLFPSHRDAPRAVITNGMVVPNYSSRQDYERGYALGVTQYGQMTAGSYCYIGPQGIVHGTTITVLNAGRKYLGLDGPEEMAGRIFVTSGLGGMSGAQPKAGTIVGCITVVAEINPAALEKRYSQGWVLEKTYSLDECVRMMRDAQREKRVTSIAYGGNIVDLLERLVQEEDELLVDLLSDQTSCHNAYGGGYYPVGLSFDEANELMRTDPPAFQEAVREGLRRHARAINALTARGAKFWDYGNSFLLEASLAGADVRDSSTESGFRYPSYVQHIMGDIFSLGFGPFRWVCLSGDPEDLRETDRIAAQVIDELRSSLDDKDPGHRARRQQYDDNYMWITRAEENRLVVGSQARILYTDAPGRRTMALAFNKAIREGRIRGPIALSRDHHDVSGADSPFRETSNIYDGSNTCADMSVHTVIGNSFRGATWVALHNGGGTGWGYAINCGFGLVLDGTEDAARRADAMLFWDVMNGVTRRAWAGNDNAQYTMQEEASRVSLYSPTMPQWADDSLLSGLYADDDNPPST